jgi:hypothetical protein
MAWISWTIMSRVILIWEAEADDSLSFAWPEAGAVVVLPGVT